MSPRVEDEILAIELARDIRRACGSTHALPDSGRGWIPAAKMQNLTPLLLQRLGSAQMLLIWPVTPHVPCHPELMSRRLTDDIAVNMLITSWVT